METACFAIQIQVVPVNVFQTIHKSDWHTAQYPYVAKLNILFYNTNSLSPFCSGVAAINPCGAVLLFYYLLAVLVKQMPVVAYGVLYLE